MKITTSKLPPPRVTAPHGFGVNQNKFVPKKRQQNQKQAAMNQTYGGMQPWHEMAKQKVQSQDSDDGIFSRQQKNASEMNSTRFSHFG